MKPTKEKIWDLVHKWCEGQYHLIPDMNRRALMDDIQTLVGEVFVIIQAGHEGIEKLCYLTMDKKDAINKIKFLRKNHDEWTDPDQFCVQKWNGKDFKCVCTELNVKPSKTWFM